MYFVCKKSKANLKLIEKLIVSLVTLTQSVVSSANGLNHRSVSYWIEATIDFVLSVTE
jgi:hypothetical protein